MDEDESNMFLDRPLPSDRNDFLLKYDTSEDNQGNSVLEKILQDNNIQGNTLNDITSNHDFLA